MPEEKPIFQHPSAPGFKEFGAGDTIPATSLPARSTISPSQITADQDNNNPTGWADADLVRLDLDTGGRGITGFTAWTNGRPKTVVNASANFGYIACEHPDSTAANRVLGGTDHIIAPYGTLILDYDSTSSRVRVIGNSYNPASPGVMGLRGHFYNVAPGSTTAADWGDWASATALGSVSTVAATSTMPGGWTLSTSTSATGTSVIYLTKGIVNFTYIGSAHILFSTTVFFATLSDGTNTYTFSFGIIPGANSTTLAVNNSVVIRYTHGTNSGKFQGVTRDSGGTEATADLGVTVAANTVYALSVCLDKANGEARFYINGAMCGRLTSNMPTAAAVGSRAIMVKSAGTTTRTATIVSFTAATVY